MIAAGIMLITLAPFGLAMALAGSAARRAADAQHQALSRLSGLFVDRVRTLPAILAFGAEARVAAHLGTASADVARRTLAVLRIAFLSSAVLEFFAALSVALVAVYCGFSLLGLLPFPAPEHLTLTRAFFVLALAPEFYLGMRRLAAAYHDKQTGEAALAAIAAERARMPAPVATQAIPRSDRAGHARAGAAPSRRRGHRGARRGLARPRLPRDHRPHRRGQVLLLLALIGHVPVEQGTLTRDGTPFVPGALNPAIGWAGQSVALVPGTLRDNLVMTDTPLDEAATLILLGRLGLGTMIGSRGGLDAPLDHRGSGFRAGNAAAWGSPVPSSAAAPSCCWTNRPPISMPTPRARSARSWPIRPRAALSSPPRTTPTSSP
jgi:ATP-binding cassette subfamily C protein CydD